MITDRNKEDREFLHQISTPMTIISHVMKKIEKALLDPSTASDLDKLNDLLKKGQDAMKQLNDTHANFKNVIFQREQQDNSRETL